MYEKPKTSLNVLVRQMLSVWLIALFLTSAMAVMVNGSETKSESPGVRESRSLDGSGAQPRGLTSHTPISINGNSQFTSANGVTSGSGTVSNPYIIENWNISASTAHGIRIENTNAYFIIRNCVIHDGKSNYHGIYFSSVQNGKIQNCNIYNNYRGIYLSSSSNNNISANLIYNNNEYGIYLYSSTNTEIHYNNIYDNTYYGVWNWNSAVAYQADATYNWWGDASGPSGVGSGNGDAVSDNVLYDPWLMAPWT